MAKLQPTAPSLEPAGMLRIAGSQMERVRGRSHSPLGWRKSKLLAEARNLFAGPQVVTYGMLRVRASGVAPHYARILALRASLSKPLQAVASLGGISPSN